MTRNQQLDGLAKRPSLRVVERIADVDGVDPIELEPPLQEIIDTDALDRLFKSTGDEISTRRGSVSFHYHGYDVTVRADHRVVLE